ncbi:MAG: cytochrome c-type biogenesis protein CcmH [Alphaproteobacteria bacterium]
MKRRALVAAFAGLLCIAAASDPAERLADPAQEAQARAIFRDVRCLVCQNESIDDSEAELAKDLRKIVREQVATGKTNSEVKTFLTDRYGEFVLLTPQFSPGNLVLWIAPFLVVLAGAALLMVRLRARPAEAELTSAEAAQLKKLQRDETR